MKGGMRSGWATDWRSKKLRASSAALRRNSKTVGESRGAPSDFGRHPAGAGMDFFHRVDVEVRESGAAHFGVGRIGAIHGEYGGGASLAVHGELLGKVRGAVGIGHGAGGEEQKLAEIALVEGQFGDGFAG
jgi:hypothetical protein